MLAFRRAGSVCRTGLSARCLVRGRRNFSTNLRPLSVSQRRCWSARSRTGLPSAVLTGTQWAMFSSGADLPPHAPVTLPALSPTMETGTLVKWEVGIGDLLEEGDIIAQVETDKATMDMETPSVGYLATILVQEGTSDLPLGKLLAIIVEDKDMIDAFKNYTGPSAATPTSDTPTQTEPSSNLSANTAPPPAASPPPVDLPSHSVVTLPALSPTMETGSLAKWEVGIGDLLEEGDIIAQVETDKATMDMETPSVGYLATILVPEGSRDIPLGKPLAIIVENKDDIPKFEDYAPPSSVAQPTAASTPAPSTSTPKEPAPIATPTVTSPISQPTVVDGPVGRILASPFAKTLARERGVDLTSIQGSGPSGRIIGRDVTSAPVTTTPTPTVSSIGPDFEDIPLSGMRKTIAKRLQLSKQTIPHYYLSVDINMEDVTNLRRQINDDDLKLSVNDFIIKAAALSMKHVPEVNSSFMDTFIRKYNNVDISVAVSTAGGLITPIVFGADVKGLQVINQDIRELAEKARAGKLKPEEFQGGTFTISNLGMFGIRNFSAVINPPQACILAVGATEKRLLVDETSTKGYSSAPMMSVTLSCDHRVVDGAVGAEWLAVFKSYLEKPFKMLI